MREAFWPVFGGVLLALLAWDQIVGLSVETGEDMGRIVLALVVVLAAAHWLIRRFSR